MTIPEAVRGFLSRHHDPAESRDAADSLSEDHLFDSRDEVWFLLAEFGPLADHQLIARHDTEFANLRRQFSPQRLRTARSELVRRGDVVQVDVTKTPSGRRAAVWALTEETK